MAKRAETSFARWMRECGLTPTEAARRLGLQRHRVYALARGASINRPGQDTAPDLVTRFAMRAIAADLEVDEDLRRYCEPGTNAATTSNANLRVALAITAGRRTMSPWAE